jgi:hypothetical protein
MKKLMHPYLATPDRDVFSSPQRGFSAEPHDAPKDASPARKGFKKHQEPHDFHKPEDDLGLEDAVRQLFHMTLASLRGYREIGHLAMNPEVHNLVAVIAHQRAAQCRSLAQMSHSLSRQLSKLSPEDDSLVDPAAAELQIIWLRAIWSFEQEEYGRFADTIEQAEAILEDAFLSAADTFKCAGMAGICRQFALNICGTRQRLEELTHALVLNQ